MHAEGLEDGVKVKVQLFGDLRKYLPKGQELLELELPEGTTPAMMLQQLGIHPGEVWLVRANRQVIADESPFHDGDDVEVFEPIGGG